MYYDHNRYFIELQPQGPVTRHSEDAKRREQALLFVSSIYNWLQTHALNDKVSKMDVTAFGQVRITCEADIISRLRDDDIVPIATIRRAASYVEGMGRTGRK